MINHNAKNGFPSNIVNEKYTPIVVRFSNTPDYEVHQSKSTYDVFVTHDLFGSVLSIQLEDETIVINMNTIILDILEVEHENENLYADR